MTAIKKFLSQPINVSSLAVFRIFFGLMMAFSMMRFMLKGWVYDLYIRPKFFFTFYGFDWVKPWPDWGMYAHFILLFILAIFIALGFYYRLSMLFFFLGFTYVELIDKSNYLNHYYFISLISGLMILMPLHCKWSLDAWRNPKLYASKIPAWPLYTLRLQIGLVYFFAGVAKLNSDWFFHAQPLRTWLSMNVDFPVIGGWFNQAWLAYAMSWIGAFFDLTVPFFLLHRRLRPFAYLVVIVFHIFTWKLFRIGMFPWIMIVSTTLFFASDWPEKLYKKLSKTSRSLISDQPPHVLQTVVSKKTNMLYGFLGMYFALQIFLPLRHYFYPGNVMWGEEGFRFSWRVMLMEKNGSIDFRVVEPSTGKRWLVNPNQYLLPYQQKQMSTQPDMILQMAHHIAQDFTARGVNQVQVYADANTSLNGRLNQKLVDPSVDLAQEKRGFHHKKWIMPFIYSAVP